MGTNIISRKALNDFAETHPDARDALIAWYAVVRKSEFANFAEVQATFATASWVNPDYVIFNIRGNHYRLITRVNFQFKTVWIKHVLTHVEYDRWKP